jgi:hypothetical protein
MFTSLALAALWGALVPQVTRLSLIPEQDYRQARVIATREQKPLAIFVGKGENAWRSVVRGAPEAEARALLAQRFVLVYVDQATEYGQAVSASLNLVGKSGLVISSRGGDLMAYRHEGEIAAPDLTRTLGYYGLDGLIVTTTETNAAAPAPAPVYVAPAVYQNSYANPFACPT